MKRDQIRRCWGGEYRSYNQAQRFETNAFESIRISRVFRLGFSLLELLLTVAIILVLASLYWGPNAGSRQRALQTACQKNLQKILGPSFTVTSTLVDAPIVRAGGKIPLIIQPAATAA